MKKLLASFAICSVLATGAFALSFEASAGGAYGFTSLTQKTTSGDVTTTSKTTDNSFGAKAAVTANINRDLGLQFEGSFLWPTKYKTTTSYSNSETVNTSEGDRSNSFVFNGFIGPVYNLSLTRALKLRLGAGFDFAYNKYTTTSSVTFLSNTTTYTDTTSYWSYGIAAKADAIYKINKNLDLKAGLTCGYLWGNSYKNVITTTANNNSSKTENSGAFNANGLYLIPDISISYRF